MCILWTPMLESAKMLNIWTGAYEYWISQSAYTVKYNDRKHVALSNIR